jgi:Protein of unknown function (DUF3011)
MQRRSGVRTAVLVAVVVTAGLQLPGLALAQATRSAQSDCAREANRKGYQVVRTGDFRQITDGWQLVVTLRNAQGRTDDGVCTVRTSTGQVSFSGFDFGGGGDGGGMRFDCASDGYKYRECQLPVDGRARLVRQYSDDKGPCREGYSWGQRGDRLWVDRGCRAQFEVVRGDAGGGAQYFDCRSTDGRYRECRIQGGSEAQLVRTYTNSCRKDSTWGVRPGVVWVTAGCQAQFRAIGGPGGGGGGSSVIQQRAEVSCRTEAERQYIAVLNITPARNQGSYWQAIVHGKLRGHPVAADCRYDPQSNRSSLFVDQGGGSAGGGSTELRVRAETACLAHAKRVGYAVVGQRAAVFVQNGLTVAVQLKQGNALYQASCFYETRSGKTRLDQVRPQPR